MSLLDDLTPKQRRFVEHYTGPDRGNAIQSAKKAGYGAGMAPELMNNEKIVNAIIEQNELQKKKMFYDEQAILERLWEEATFEGKGSSQNARIQALVYLGKHIGMWDDKSKALAEAKQQKGDITYNIINFSDSKKEDLQDKVVHTIEQNKESVEKERERLDLKPSDDILEGVVLTNYVTKE